MLNLINFTDIKECNFKNDGIDFKWRILTRKRVSLNIYCFLNTGHVGVLGQTANRGYGKSH